MFSYLSLVAPRIKVPIGMNIGFCDAMEISDLLLLCMIL